MNARPQRAGNILGDRKGSHLSDLLFLKGGLRRKANSVYLPLTLLLTILVMLYNKNNE